MLNDVLALEVVDTGSSTILLDPKMAEALGVLVKQAKSVEFRYYIVLGALKLHAYWGMMD